MHVVVHDHRFDYSGDVACLAGVHKNNTIWPCMQALMPEHQAVFLDTDSQSARESGTASALTNIAEANAAMQLVEALIQAGMPPHDIGIMSPYRSQV